MRQHESELKIVGRIKTHEGELNEKEPAHVGGVSYRGITQRTFEEWTEGEGKLKAKGITDVRQLVDHPDVVDAFYHDYLKNAWHLPDFLQYLYCDFYTNGQSNANKIIQRMIGIEDDGIWGSGTTRAVKQWRAETEDKLTQDPFLDNDLIMQFHDQKIAHYEKLATSNPELYGANLVGWKKRAMRVLAEHQEYFEDDEPVATAVDPADIPPPKPVAQETDTLPYHTYFVQEDDDDIDSKLNALLLKEVGKGYVLSTITPLTETNQTLAALGNKVLVVTEHNPDKASKLLNT